MKNRFDLIGRKEMVDADTEAYIPIVAAFDVTDACPRKDIGGAEKVLLLYVRAQKGLIAELRFCDSGKDAGRMGCFWFVEGLVDERSEENDAFHLFAGRLGHSYQSLHTLVKSYAPAMT